MKMFKFFLELEFHFGWKVEYDKPAYNESYEPSFIFEKGSSR